MVRVLSPQGRCLAGGEGGREGTHVLPARQHPRSYQEGLWPKLTPALRGGKCPSQAGSGHPSPVGPQGSVLCTLLSPLSPAVVSRATCTGQAGSVRASVSFLWGGSWGATENTALPGVTAMPAATDRVGVPLALRSRPHLLLSNFPAEPCGSQARPGGRRLAPGRFPLLSFVCASRLKAAS